MDPNVTLEKMIELSLAIQNLLDKTGDFEDLQVGHMADQLSEAVLDLNKWISNGGFLPNNWAQRD